MTIRPQLSAEVGAYGLVDVPTQDDKLGMAPYVEALTSFISGCPTPMTIAIQGDWGSGKTSVMEMVQKRLNGGNSLVVTFNTWQYSQFDLGHDLVLNLIQSIADQIDDEHGEESSKVRRCLDILKVASIATADSALTVAAFMAGGTIGQAAYAGVKKGFAARRGDEDRSADSTPLPDVVAALIALRENFAKMIAQQASAAGRDRAVIFIDDLDRLPPKRSVEVMEGLKSLLDCEGCVFVLAIDFSVVAQGVVEKYGPTMDESKAKAFFDKIIQLPFLMPTSQFNVGGLLRCSLDTLAIGVDESGDFEAYENLIRLSIGTNPRALKRLLNSFSLLRRIPTDAASVKGLGSADSDPASRRYDDLELFALLALQAGYPDFYDAIVSTPAEQVSTMLTEAMNNAQGLDETSAEKVREYGVSALVLPTFAGFLGVMTAALPAGFSESDRLAQRINLTAVTSVRGSQRAVGRLPRATVMDLGDRAARLIEKGVSKVVIDRATDLEILMRDHLAARDLPFSAAEQAKGVAWSWYATDSDFKGSRRRTFCEVYFAQHDGLNIYFCRDSWPQDFVADLVSRTRTVADQNDWKFEIGKSGNILRLYGLANSKPLGTLIPLLSDCYAQAKR